MSATYVAAADFEPIADLSVLTDYRWGDRDVNHLFCKACGVYPYHGDQTVGYRVNLGCIDAIDTFALDISIIDGKAM